MTVEFGLTPVAATRRLTRLMGCRASVTISAAPVDVDGLLGRAVRRMRHLERCWSRFLPDSDISRLNRAGGRAVDVDPSTVVLLREMAEAVRATAGAFDPTLLGTIVGLGYGPAWSGGLEHCSRPASREHLNHHTAWIDDTMIDIEAGRIVVPSGVQIDPGAIGKGLAADIVAGEMCDDGATAVAVTIGGDVRTTAPATVGIAAPDESRRIVDRIRVAAGGIATSGTGRRWLCPGGHLVHHVLDPQTRRPIDRFGPDEIVQVSVAASTGASAEVWATAALVDGACLVAERLDGWGVAALSIRRDGSNTPNSAWRSLRIHSDAADTRIEAAAQ